MSIGRNHIYARLLVVLLACSVALTFVFGSTPSAHANAAQLTTLGGLDLRGYCQSLGFPSVTTVGTTYYDWRCIDRNGNDVAFSLLSACQWQYHNPDAWDTTDNFYRATGGVCVQATVAGGINMRAFCQGIGYLDTELDGSTAYDWRCDLYDPNSSTGIYAVPIDLNYACQWLYHTPHALARFTDFYSATSLQCLV